MIARREVDGDAPPRERNYDVLAALVAERVGQTASRISVRRLLPGARAAGVRGIAADFR